MRCKAPGLDGTEVEKDCSQASSAYMSMRVGSQSMRYSLTAEVGSNVRLKVKNPDELTALYPDATESGD